MQTAHTQEVGCMALTCTGKGMCVSSIPSELGFNDASIDQVGKNTFPDYGFSQLDLVVSPGKTQSP